MKPETKKERILYAFLESGMDGLSQVEVASPYQGYTFRHQAGKFWSSCLNSDVSVLGKQGITVARQPDPYVNKAGDRAQFKRYWLKDRDAARQVLSLLNLCRNSRNEAPLPEYLAQTLVDQFPETRQEPRTS